MKEEKGETELMAMEVKKKLKVNEEQEEKRLQKESRK